MKVRTPSVETLKELIDSRYTVYDVLPSFFNYNDSWITLGMSHSRGCEDPVSETNPSCIRRLRSPLLPRLFPVVRRLRGR